LNKLYSMNIKEHRLEKNFAICGLTGWCMEIIYTSLGSLRKKDFTLMGNTSIWMFPIYGMASMIGETYPILKKFPPLFRGGIYSAGILSFEYMSGSLLKKHKLWIFSLSGWAPDSSLNKSSAAGNNRALQDFYFISL